MTRSMKRAVPAAVSVFLILVATQVPAQQNFQSMESVTAIPDLRVNAAIPMPTTQMRGREFPSDRVASPFSGFANSHNPAAPQDELRYPGDLQYHGGHIIKSAANHALFVNPSSKCQPNSCWGDPTRFLSDLSYSTFIHVTDQYVNSHASNRYPVGTNFVIPAYAPSAGAGKPFTNSDLATAAYAAAAATNGFGYHDIYHLFLVPGQDVCFDSTFSVCYSPDNPNTWYFCAYHGSARDSAGNVVLYTVEPYQNVPGCQLGPGTPNGQLADSTYSVLSHELFETITDPKGSAWWNQLNNGMYGQEIGDECSFLLFTTDAVYFDPTVVRLNHKLYATQPEYSNSQHACSTAPSD